MINTKDEVNPLLLKHDIIPNFLHLNNLKDICLYSTINTIHVHDNPVCDLYLFL